MQQRTVGRESVTIQPDCGCEGPPEEISGGATRRLRRRQSPSAARRSRSGSTGRPKLLRLEKSHRAAKKYDAVFEMPNGRIKRVPFGAYHESGPSAGQPYADFTMHHDEARRRRYVQRHSRRESFTDPTKPSTLARYILWEAPTVSGALAAYRRRFGV